jgi:hypothetical protein
LFSSELCPLILKPAVAFSEPNYLHQTPQQRPDRLLENKPEKSFFAKSTSFPGRLLRLGKAKLLWAYIWADSKPSDDDSKGSDASAKR